MLKLFSDIVSTAGFIWISSNEMGTCSEYQARFQFSYSGKLALSLFVISVGKQRLHTYKNSLCSCPLCS